jgi:hypothetical protein
MDRRKFLSLLPADVAASRPLAALAKSGPVTARPNFLFLIADDLTYRSIQSRNNDEVHPPNFDSIRRCSECNSSIW